MNSEFGAALAIGFYFGMGFLIIVALIVEWSRVGWCERENSPYQCRTVTIPVMEASNDE